MKTKSVTVKKFGWKRISRKIQRFGWLPTEVVQNTNITRELAPVWDRDGRVVGHTETDRSTKITMTIDFCRDSSWYQNLASIWIFEMLFNLVFFIRRVVGALLPLAAILACIVAFFQNLNEDVGTTIENDPLRYLYLPLIIGISVWVGCKILESVFSLIAKVVLKQRGMV